MNLMFWRKKTGAGEEAENAREDLAVNTKPRGSLDFVAAQQDVAEHSPESPDPGAASTETPASPGLAARMKLRLSALTSHFRRAPAFRAEEGHVPDAHGGPGKTADAATIEPGMEAPAKPGLAVRIKAGFVAFIREIKAPATPAASEDQEDADSHGRSKAVPEDEYPEGEQGIEPVRSRKRLVIGGAIGLLVLLLVGIGIAIWPVFTPPQKRWGTRHDITTITSRPIQPESAPDEPPTSAPEKSQAEVEALKKENAELQARIEALKKEQPQQRPYVPPARQTGRNAPSSSVSGETMVDNKDPKAAAMSLKEAIEVMNASTGDYDKKPAK